MLESQWNIQLRRAQPKDAFILTEICTRAFDQAIRVWVKGEPDLDSNISPPGYASVRMHSYVIREWDYYVIEWNGSAIGGVSVNVLGSRHARLDKIFIEPVCQGRGIGSQVIRLVEAEFAEIEVWKLETSGRQRGNHFFYEKMGYVCLYASEDEYGYEKIITTEPRVQLPTEELSNVKEESVNEFYQAELDSVRFSTSNLREIRMTDCNLSGGKFTNLNMTGILLADLRLTDSSIEFCALGGVHFQDTHLGPDNIPMRWEHCDLRQSLFKNCDLSGVQLEQCQVAGMKINGVAIEELLVAYECMKGRR